MAEQNYESELEIKNRREFTLRDFCNLFNYSEGGMWLLLDRIGVKPIFKQVNGRRKAFYNYEDYLEVKSHIPKKSIIIKTVEDANEHPLVTYKHFLDINYWPDVTLNYEEAE